MPLHADAGGGESIRCGEHGLNRYHRVGIAMHQQDGRPADDLALQGLASHQRT